MSEDRAIRLAVAAGAGVVGGWMVAAALAALGPGVAAVAALWTGFLAGVAAGTARRALVAVACGTLPAVAIDLFVVPAPPVELGGFLQVAFGVEIGFFALLGVVGATIGAAGAKAGRMDPVRSARRRIALAIAALAAFAGWLWISASMATASI
jgi:hypothetical protein